MEHNFDDRWDSLGSKIQALFPNIMLSPTFFTDIYEYLEESLFDENSFIEIAKYYAAKEPKSISSKQLILAAKRFKEKNINTAKEIKGALDEKASIIHLRRNQTEEEQLLTLFRGLNIGERQRVFSYMESILEHRGIEIRKRKPKEL